MVREIRGVLSLAPQHGWRVPIVQTEALTGAGTGTLMAKLDEHRAWIAGEGTLSKRRRRNLRAEVLALATARLRRQLEARLAEDPDFQSTLDEVVSRRLDPASAAKLIVDGEV
jgi:LAO/AO transport system kinase